MNLGANIDQEWTSSEVEEARSIITGGYHEENKKLNIISELQEKFPSKPMHQVRDLYVDIFVEMSMMQCQEKEYGGADRMHGVICTIDGHVNKNYGVLEEEDSMDDKEFSHGFPLKHAGVVETMKEVPVPKENKGEVLENKMSIHQPVEHCTKRFWTTEEHRLFLRGLRGYGRGKWKDISKYFVTSRAPVQISSHAQKYFKRLQSKRSGMQRYSIHDVELDEEMENSSRPSKHAATIPTSSFHQVPSNPCVTMDNIARFKFPF